MTKEKYYRKAIPATEEERRQGIECTFVYLKYPEYPCEVCGRELPVERDFDADGAATGYHVSCGHHGKTQVPKSERGRFDAFFESSVATPDELAELEA